MPVWACVIKIRLNKCNAKHSWKFCAEKLFFLQRNFNLSFNLFITFNVIVSPDIVSSNTPPRYVVLKALLTLSRLTHIRDMLLLSPVLYLYIQGFIQAPTDLRLPKVKTQS